jgi:2-amino-4-hydroxy-6-hydroxymethyldihydropteridine diphosphokinase
VKAKAVLSLGSNLGDRERNLREAVADIGQLSNVTVDATSSVVETAAIKPSGVDESAPAYLNVVVRVTTSLTSSELLTSLGAIEIAHGRVRDVRWGDRTLDIDIVTFGDEQRSDPALTLPHPRAAERAFVLVPWLEVDPDAVLPGIGRIDALPAASESVSRYPAEALS